MVDGLIAIAVLVIAVCVFFYFSIPVGILFAMLTIIYAALLYARTKGAHLHFFSYKTKEISSMIPNLLKSLDTPIIIVGESNKIIWANKYFESLPELSSHVLLPTSDAIMHGHFSYENLEDEYNSDRPYFDINDPEGDYRVRVLCLNTKPKQYFAAVLYDSGKEMSLMKDLRDSNVMIALASIDNASELTQNGNESFRLTAAKISVELTEWAKGFNGLITEFEIGSFLLIFERRYLDQMEEDRFHIIDRITELSAGVSSLPLTISIGVCEEKATVADKYLSAQNALRIAYQKGGAVAIVKTSDGYRSYGGKTKSVQKQTNIRSRVCADLLISNIESSSNVLVMGHLRPDFDSIASNVGISKLVSKLGKKVHIVTDVTEGNIANAFEMLDSIPEYGEMFVDARAGMDLMTPDTLLIITDASNPVNFYSEDLYQNAQRVVIIDHHTLDHHLKETVLQPYDIDPNASSASELVCEMLEIVFPENILRPEEAQLMLTGILLDTQFFSRDTGSRTFRACAFLRNAGADSAIVKTIFKSDISEFERTNRFLENRSVFHNSFMIASYDGDADPQNMVCAAKAAEQLVNIQGIVASFVLYKTSDGIALSARSDGSFNVVNVVRPLGGGGHFQSAGAKLVHEGAPVMDMQDAITIVKQTIVDCLESNNL
ncbi:MAG: DHH family phosphoesterase [Clostridia bacterium]|nr:DHH family phosphoesterase [Clostridia bacterium]